MTADFDPYRKWLGIPVEERPVNHYRLLGVKLFEDDADVLSNAADRQMAYIRGFQTGPHSVVSQQILNELSAARVCLLDPTKKAAYDAGLRKVLAARDEGVDMDAIVSQLLRGAGRYLVVAAKRSWLQWWTLPGAYLMLGIAVRGDRRYTERLGARLAEIASLADQVRQAEQLGETPGAPPPPPGTPQPPPQQVSEPRRATFWDGVKRIPALLAKRVRIARLEWRQRRALRRLGAEAFQIDGVVAGPSELTAPIQESKAAVERLAAEQKRLQTVQPGQGVAPAWIAWAGLAFVALIVLLILRIRFF
jgi:hypothetical protein